MSPITWSLSLAKYLEIWFYAGGTPIKAPQGDGAESSSAFKRHFSGPGLISINCPHPLHQPHHHQYFYNNAKLAVVSYILAPVRTMIFPPTPLPIHPLTSSKEDILEQLRQIAVKGYSLFEGIFEKISPEDDFGKTEFLKHKRHFKSLYDTIQLDLTSHKLEGGMLRASLRPDVCAPPHKQKTHPSSAIPTHTMLAIQDKIVLLHRIVAKSLSYWNLKYCKKEESPGAVSGAEESKGIGVATDVTAIEPPSPLLKSDSKTPAYTESGRCKNK